MVRPTLLLSLLAVLACPSRYAKRGDSSVAGPGPDSASALRDSFDAVPGPDTTPALRDSFDALPGPDTAPALEFPAERTYRELALQIPSLGGWYFDTASGNLVVYVKDLGQADSARSLVGSRLAHELHESRRRHPQAHVVARQAAYTWLELKHWRDLLRHVMPDTPGMVALGIGEDRNRLEVGVDSAADSIPVRKLARSLRVPDEALVIEVTGPLVPFSKPSPPPP